MGGNTALRVFVKKPSELLTRQLITKALIPISFQSDACSVQILNDLAIPQRKLHRPIPVRFVLENVLTNTSAGDLRFKPSSPQLIFINDSFLTSKVVFQSCLIRHWALI
jgi:hypothetical protein